MNALPHQYALRRDHLRASLDWIWGLLELRMRDMQAAGTAPAPDDPFPSVIVSPMLAEARLRVRANPTDESGIAQARARIIAAQAQCDALVRLRRRRDDVPLIAIREAFDLDEVSWVAVLLGIAVELEPDIAPTLAYLQHHFDRRQPSPALLVELLGEDLGRLRLGTLFDPHGPLMRHRLLELDPSRPFEPLLHTAYRIDRRLVRYLENPGAIDAELGAFLTHLDPAAITDDLVFKAPESVAWDRFRVLTGASREALAAGPVIALRGPAGAGCTRWTLELARRLDTTVVVIDLQRLNERAFGGLADGLRVALREALLLGAVAAIDGWNELLDAGPVTGAEGSHEAMRQRHRERVLELVAGALDRHPGAVVLAVEPGPEVLPAPRRGLEVIEVPTPGFDARRVLWSTFLTPAMRASDVEPNDLARRFVLTPGRIKDAAQLARRTSAHDDRARVDMPAIADAVRTQIQARMGSTAKIKRPTESWADLVVAPEVNIQLRELCHRYRYRDRVMDDWGLRRRFASGLGISALFEGPPGTGKTMSAGIVAHELALDLYQIDLSQVVSKWIGETEKNLSKVFDEAERSGAMLLFDEADSLFSKRTSVSSSNDRYANLEVNYLLQRVEAFTGIAVLTTNFADSIDSAFARRLSMRVTFPAPTAEERAALWRTMLDQPDLPRGTVDADALGADFELAGGHIKNAVLRAAFLAASRGMPIDHALIELAARIELKEQGMLVRGDPHADLVAMFAR